MHTTAERTTVESFPTDPGYRRANVTGRVFLYMEFTRRSGDRGQRRTDRRFLVTERDPQTNRYLETVTEKARTVRAADQAVADFLAKEKDQKNS